jgi:hypothetical protein
MERVAVDVVIQIAVRVDAIPAGHCIADVVAANRDQQIQVGLQPVRPDVRVVEQVVLIRPAQQQDGPALVLPIERIGLIGV